MDYYKIGERIRKYRKACNYSQEQLAEITGISITHLSHIETGNTKLSLPVFIAIASALHVNTDELLCDKIELSSDATKREIIQLIDSCSVSELNIIKEMIHAIKSALNKYIY